MLLFELYKVLTEDVIVTIYNNTPAIIYRGFIDNLDIDILQCRVTYLNPISPQEILIQIDI